MVSHPHDQTARHSGTLSPPLCPRSVARRHSQRRQATYSSPFPLWCTKVTSQNKGLASCFFWVGVPNRWRLRLIRGRGPRAVQAGLWLTTTGGCAGSEVTPDAARYSATSRPVASPIRIAYLTRSSRLERFNFRVIACRCFSTVLMLRTSVFAISRFVCP